MQQQRIAKFIANAGICSRREAESLVKLGQVKIDNIIIESPATNVTDQNIIEVCGKIVKAQTTTRLWLYYKPAGLITTNKDPQNRKTIFSELVDLPRVISVGRLDLNSEGLLLLTNNGDYARHLELPSSNIERIYKVRAYGVAEKLLSAKYPMIIEGISYNPKSIKFLSKTAQNSWFEVILTEGKNREIRKIFNHFGLSVSRLIRVKYGDFELGNLKIGEYREV